jgi:hypothetical protein
MATAARTPAANDGAITEPDGSTIGGGILETRAFPFPLSKGRVEEVAAGAALVGGAGVVGAMAPGEGTGVVVSGTGSLVIGAAG